MSDTFDKAARELLRRLEDWNNIHDDDIRQRMLDIIKAAMDTQLAAATERAEKAERELVIVRQVQKKQSEEVAQVLTGFVRQLATARTALEEIPAMRKRVWTPDEYGGYQEMADGAVPIWWLSKHIAAVLAALDAGAQVESNVRIK